MNCWNNSFGQQKSCIWLAKAIFTVVREGTTGSPVGVWETRVEDVPNDGDENEASEDCEGNPKEELLPRFAVQVSNDGNPQEKTDKNSCKVRTVTNLDAVIDEIPRIDSQTDVAES